MQQICWEADMCPVAAYRPFHVCQESQLIIPVNCRHNTPQIKMLTSLFCWRRYFLNPWIIMTDGKRFSKCVLGAVWVIKIEANGRCNYTLKQLFGISVIEIGFHLSLGLILESLKTLCKATSTLYCSDNIGRPGLQWVGVNCIRRFPAFT